MASQCTESRHYAKLQKGIFCLMLRARLFGANALFSQILPLLMSPTLEDQERHLLVNFNLILG